MDDPEYARNAIRKIETNIVQKLVREYLIYS